jgi:hypothetical protein
VNVALACADPGIDTSSLLDDYAGFVDTLARSEQTKRIRCRQAAVFMERVGDLDAWMRRTTIERLTQIRRLEVWPFLSWCFATGCVVPDLELIAAKGKGAHFSLWAAMHPSDLDELRLAAVSFGWTPIWRDRIAANAYPLLGLTRGTGLHAITPVDLDAVDSDIAASMLLAPITKTHLTAQNHSLRALCYQLGIIDDPPVHPNVRACTPAHRAAGVPQPRIREVIAHYLSTVDSVLRPKTVAARAEALTGFTHWLAEVHPEVGSVPQLTRTHIEEFLAFNARRPCRGRRGRGRSISAIHHTTSSSTCAASSTTSPPGDGTSGPARCWCIAETSHARPTRCHARWRPTPTAH